MKTALVLMIKNENNYIKEFLDYYKKIGVDTVHICDNNDIDGESPLHIIEPYINDGFVKYWDIRGLKKYQLGNHVKMYETLKSEYDWILFFDTDEFLVFNNNFTNVKDWLSQDKFKCADQILVNWTNYGDNDILNINNNCSVFKFTKPCKDYGYIPTIHPSIIMSENLAADYVVKCIVRGGLENIIFKSTHFAESPNTVNVNGEKIACCMYQPEHIDDVVLHHYTSKTLEEYLLRCDGDVKYANDIVLVNSKLLSFFSTSKYNTQKHEIIRKKYPWFSYRPDLYDSPIDIVINRNEIRDIDKLIDSIRVNMSWVNNIFVISNNIDDIDFNYYTDKNVLFISPYSFVPTYLHDSLTDSLIDTYIWNITGLSEKFIYFYNVQSINYPCFEEEFFPNNKLNLHSVKLKFIPEKDNLQCFTNTFVIMQTLNLAHRDFVAKNFYIYDPYYIPMLKSDCETCFNYMQQHIMEYDESSNTYVLKTNRFLYSTWSYVMRHFEDNVKLTRFYTDILSNNIDNRVLYKIV